MLKLVAAAGSLVAFALGDVPTNCAVDTLWGDWQFQMGFSGSEADVTGGILDQDGNYLNLGDVTGTKNFRFSLYNNVEDLDTGAMGTFTTIYNQGFEISIYNQKWFVYYWFNGHDFEHYDCSKSSVGWVTDSLGTTYTRIQGAKTDTSEDLSSDHLANVWVEEALESPVYDQLYREDKEFISKVNEHAQGIWTAKYNEANSKYSLREMMKRGGQVALETLQEERPHFDMDSIYTRSVQDLLAKAVSRNAEVHAELAVEGQTIPTNVDWRNVNGENFVGTVDDQANCGSCYSFGSMGLLESRVRIMTNNALQPKFSQQEIITCGKAKTYNQGCNGGWSFIIAGKYAQAVGVVEEHCAPYESHEGGYDALPCPDVSDCQRWHVSDYGYLGGYYGATEWDGGKAMMMELQNGPVAVGFMVQGDFRDYESGVWFATGVSSDWNPIVQTNHAVLCVGYGVCSGVGDKVCGDSTPAGTPYWIGKNSWGTSFGMDGYFLILRGVNEVGFEGMPFVASPIPRF